MSATTKRKQKHLIVIDSSRSEQGAVFPIQGGKLGGWYNSSKKNNEIILFVNGEEYHRTSADVARDVKSGGRNNMQAIGFEFDLSQLSRRIINVLTLAHAETGFDFDSLSLNYCPIVNKYRRHLREYFFAEYYKNKYELWRYSNREAFNFYANTGIYLDHDPNPWFSTRFYREHYSHKLGNLVIPILSYIQFEKELKIRPSNQFDPEYYYNSNPDLKEIPSLLSHYVNYGHREGRYPAPRRIPERLNEEIKTLSRIEPALSDFSTRERHVIHYPVLSRSTFLPRFIQKSYGDSFQVIICVPFLSCGGADLISLFIVQAFQQKFGNDKVLLLITDKSKNSVPAWINRKTQLIFLDDETQFESFDDRVRTLHAIIGTINPEIVVNVNSHTAWEVFTEYGKQLSSVSRLLAYLFCFDYTADKRLAGYIKSHLPTALPYLETVMFDNAQIVKDVNDLYGFSETQAAKLKTVYVPLPGDVSPTKSHTEDRRLTGTILWTGRLARQKRPELLLSIADAMPCYKFVVYGPEGDSPHCAPLLSESIPNLEYRGVYSSLNELDYSEFDLFLNTSEWDGLPTVLIQMMGLGLPIVSSCAGGISELVTDNTGWLVCDDSNADAYVFTIKNAIINKKETLRRAENGLALVKERHVWTTFYHRLDSLGVFNSGNSIRQSDLLPLKNRKRA